MMDVVPKKKWENAVSASKIISLLVEGIEKKFKSNELNPKECAELRTLRDKCCDENAAVSVSAFHAINKLVEKNILLRSQTISLLLSILPSVTHCAPLVSTIGNILLLDTQDQTASECEFDYNFTDKSHPFVTILKHDTEKSWDSIYSYMVYILNNEDDIKYSHKINMLQTVMLFICCDPSANLVYRDELLLLLLNQIDKPKIKQIIIYILAWQNIDIKYCWFLYRVFHLLLSPGSSDNLQLIESLKPFLAEVIRWLILNGKDPQLWVDLLHDSLKLSSSRADEVLCILSEVILDTPPLFLDHIIELCKYLICSSFCSTFIVHKFVSSALIWMATPSSLARPVYKSLDHIIKFVTCSLHSESRKKTYCSNAYDSILKNSNGNVKLAVEMKNLCNSWEKDKTLVLKWLKSLLASNNREIEKKLHSFICGIVLCEGDDDEILDVSSAILLRASENSRELSFFYLCVAFFKLSREVNPRNQLRYISVIVKLANSKENVPVILGIIESLKNGNDSKMTPIVIDLCLKLWKIDNRSYPYLHKALFNTSSVGENSWEINVMKTIAMREICRLFPELHGKSLVSKLSEILNDCDNYVSGVPSAIAIEAVIELCRAHVTDITGTWRALKPKLSRDNRVEVIISLCKLFSEVPALKPPGAERDGLISDIVPRLWNYSLSSNPKISKAALESLSKFPPESYGPSLIPNQFYEGISIPKQFYKSSNDESRDQYLNQLEYIPGECWLELIKSKKSDMIGYAGDALVQLIEEELKMLSRKFFCHPQEIPEPANYNQLPHYSILRVLVDHIKRYLNSLEGDIIKTVPDSVKESLRILSRDYSKSLPTLNWAFLEKFLVGADDPCKMHSLTILAKQSAISKEGRKCLDNFIRENLSRFEEVNNFMFLYPVLTDLCNSLGPNTLRQFLDVTIKTAFKSSLHSSNEDFEKVLVHVKSTLENKLLFEPRKALLVTHLQNILTDIPPAHKIMRNYAEFSVALPTRCIQFISSPSSWPEVTSEKLRRSICIRTAMAMRPDSSNPLVWFNECIDAVVNFQSEQPIVLKEILNVIEKKREVNHGNWLVELMWRTQTSTWTSASPEYLQVTLFLLDIFIYATVTISGYDCFLIKSNGHFERGEIFNVFPVAMYDLLGTEDWVSLSPKILEWFHGVSKWKNLPRIYTDTFEQAILMLRNNGYCVAKNKWRQLFYLSTINKLE